MIASPIAHRRRPRTDAAERGQTLPLVCLFFVALLAMSGIVIDLGDAYLQRRSTQNVADAAALAGASAIPNGSATTVARAYADKNDVAGDQVTVAFDGTDKVTVTVSRDSPTFLLGVFGQSSIRVTSSATATVEALGAVNGHVSPYAVTVAAYANGTGTTLFKENQPGAYGTIDLPTSDNTSGGSCAGNTNLGTSPNIKAELSGTLPAGQLVVGGCLSVKSGAAQPSGSINPLPGDNKMDQDLLSLGNGQYQVISQPYDINGLPPRLMYVPIVDQLSGGNGQVNIKGFAWFYMTSATGGGSGLTINGKYVSVELPATGQTTQYVPGAQGQVLAVELTS